MVVQDKMDLPLSARMMDVLAMGEQEWAQQFTNGFPTVGALAEHGVNPIKRTAGPDLDPQQLLTKSKWRIKSRRAAAPDSHEGALWEDALNQVDAGWLAGPFPFDVEGRLVTG